MKKLLAIALALVMVLCMVACTGSEDAGSNDAEVKTIEGMTVAFIPKLTGNAFFEVANSGAQEYAKEWGINVEYMGSPNATVADQVSVINQAIASGVDAICISSVDAAGLADALQAAKDAGIVVCTWDSDVASSDRALMVSQGTPEILGEMLVQMAIDGLEYRGVNVTEDEVTYCWHYSQATVTDQNSWQVAGEAYIAENYPNWVNVNPDNYYSEQDAEKAITVGEAILDAYSDIDLIICNDSTALPGQLQAAENKGYNAQTVTITGFATPNAVKQYCTNGTIYNWGLWDCAVQGGIGCYVAAYLAAGNEVKVGDTIEIPGIGTVEVVANDSICEGDTTADINNGVVLLPERAVFNADNMNDYDF